MSFSAYTLITRKHFGPRFSISIFALSLAYLVTSLFLLKKLYRHVLGDPFIESFSILLPCYVHMYSYSISYSKVIFILICSLNYVIRAFIMFKT